MKKIVIIVLSILPFFFCLSVMAEEADPNISFLKGDYATTLKSYEASSKRTDLIQYRIGICYLKLGEYGKAEEELKEVFIYKESALLDQAQFGIGETFFLSKNFAEAIRAYQQLIKEYPKSSIRHLAYFKLGKSHSKKGEEKEALKYFKKVRGLYPLSFEAEKSNKIICQEEGYFSIQISAFVDLTRGKNLVMTFQEKGFDCYLLKKVEDKPWIYKARIGNFESKKEADLFTKQLPEKTDFFITKEE